MKKIVSLLLVLMLMLTLAVGCSPKEPTKQPSEEPATVDFSITVNGTEFTNENTKDIEFVTVSINKKDKEGKLKEAQWQGYRIKDVLEASGITEYNTVKVAAGDGYSVDLTKEVVEAETTLLGFVKDGEALSSEDAPRLTVEGEGSNVWIKGVASIEAK